MNVKEAKQLADNSSKNKLRSKVKNYLIAIEDLAKDGNYEVFIDKKEELVNEVAKILQKEYGYILDYRTQGFIKIKWSY